MAKKSQPVNPKKKDTLVIRLESSTPKDPAARALISQTGSGSHQNRNWDLVKGRTRKSKHRETLHTDELPVREKSN